MILYHGSGLEIVKPDLKQWSTIPKILIKNIPNKSEQWKAPAKIWIRDMYEKRYGRTNILSGCSVKSLDREK